MGVATLVLCPYANSWPYTSARVTGQQPFTLVLAHWHHARHWSHHGTNGVGCTVPHGPTNRQYGLIKPRPTVSVRFLCFPPIRPAPSCCLRGLVFRVLQPDQSSHLSFGEPLATSWIFPVYHCYPALVSINPSVHLHVHCVIHLAQDCFLYRSSGRLVVGKAAKGVAPVPGSETKCYTPRRAVRRRPVLGQRERRSPQRKDYIINKQSRLNVPGYIAKVWAHYTHLEGLHSHIKCYRVKVFVQTNPQTRLQCAQDGAIVVPGNDTQTQCTTKLEIS